MGPLPRRSGHVGSAAADAAAVWRAAKVRCRGSPSSLLSWRRRGRTAQSGSGCIRSGGTAQSMNGAGCWSSSWRRTPRGTRLKEEVARLQSSVGTHTTQLASYSAQLREKDLQIQHHASAQDTNAKVAAKYRHALRGEIASFQRFVSAVLSTLAPEVFSPLRPRLRSRRRTLPVPRDRVRNHRWITTSTAALIAGAVWFPDERAVPRECVRLAISVR